MTQFGGPVAHVGEAIRADHQVVPQPVQVDGVLVGPDAHEEEVAAAVPVRMRWRVMGHRMQRLRNIADEVEHPGQRHCAGAVAARLHAAQVLLQCPEQEAVLVGRAGGSQPTVFVVVVDVVPVPPAVGLEAAGTYVVRPAGRVHEEGEIAILGVETPLVRRLQHFVEVWVLAQQGQDGGQRLRVLRLQLRVRDRAGHHVPLATPGQGVVAPGRRDQNQQQRTDKEAGPLHALARLRLRVTWRQ